MKVLVSLRLINFTVQLGKVEAVIVVDLSLRYWPSIGGRRRRTTCVRFRNFVAVLCKRVGFVGLVGYNLRVDLGEVVGIIIGGLSADLSIIVTAAGTRRALAVATR